VVNDIGRISLSGLPVIAMLLAWAPSLFFAAGWAGGRGLTADRRRARSCRLPQSARAAHQVRSGRRAFAGTVAWVQRIFFLMAWIYMPAWFVISALAPFAVDHLLPGGLNSGRVWLMVYEAGIAMLTWALAIISASALPRRAQGS